MEPPRLCDEPAGPAASRRNQRSNAGCLGWWDARIGLHREGSSVRSVSGSVKPGFEPVADAFARSFTTEAMGAALCIYLHGRPVVDLCGGLADAQGGAPWTADTISVIFSCTKGLMSILAARLVEDGRLEYDAPVSRYWPEVAAA